MLIQKQISRLRTEAIKSRKNIYLISEKLKFKDGTALTPEGEGWENKIKFICLKSFKVSWDKGVKGAGDVINTDNLDNDRIGKIKYYFNKPLFSISKEELDFLKRNFEDFKEGFYEYLNYLMEQVENIKKKENKDYVLDRNIFLVTSSKNKEDIDWGRNLIAIDTEGNNRPSYKGTPEPMHGKDVETYRQYSKNPFNIPINNPTAQQGM